MFDKRREDAPEEARVQSYRHISGLIGVPPDTIRGWVDRARVDGGEKPGVTTAEREEIKALRAERWWSRGRARRVQRRGPVAA